MQKITTVLIDMYGVILKESKGNFIPYTFGYFQPAEHERLKRQFKEEQLFTKAGRGELTSDMFLSMLGYENTQYHMKDYIENHLTLDCEFIPFAEKFSRRCDFVLLSNDVSEWSAYITEHYQLNRYFQHKIVSGDVKCRKPEKHIFEVALEKIGRQSSECVFIDNSVKNLETAGELGIYSILFNRDNEEYTGTKVDSFAELAMILEQITA